MRRHTEDALAVEFDATSLHLAVMQREQSRDRADHRGLAGAIGAEQRNNAAFGNGEVNAVECQALTRVAHRKTADLKHRGHQASLLVTNRLRSWRPRPATPPGAKIKSRITSMPNTRLTSCGL